MSAEFVLPKSDERITVIGATGSGKTYAGVFHLSRQDFDVKPWVVIDYKGDELINRIEKAKRITYDDIPTEAGIYILKVLPDEELILDNWFRKVWETENIGVYVDEGFMIGRQCKYFNACLTQGRSKNIPMIVLTQRPAWISRFAFSESSFFQVFRLTDKDDIKTVSRFIPGDITKRLPEFCSYYYNVGDDTLIKLGPVADGDTLLEIIDSRYPEKKDDGRMKRL